MAERRMFSSKIVCSDAFTDMPFSAQALYFQLNMEADDDGFLNNARRVQRTICASDADLDLLLTKRFLLGFANGVVVVKHWRINNQIRKDRYTPTQYQDEFAMLEIKPDGAYTEKAPEEPVDTLATTWQPDGNQMATQVRLGKVRLGKVSKEECEDDSGESSPPPAEKEKTTCQQIVDLYHSICKSFPAVRSLSEARKKAIKARLRTYSIDDFRTVFENAEASAFLKGSNDRDWRATFDWLIKDGNMAKVLEGNYADKPKRYTRTETKPQWMDKKGLRTSTPDVDKYMQWDDGPEVKQEAAEMQRRMQEKYGKKAVTL